MTVIDGEKVAEAGPTAANESPVGSTSCKNHRNSAEKKVVSSNVRPVTINTSQSSSFPNVCLANNLTLKGSNICVIKKKETFASSSDSFYQQKDVLPADMKISNCQSLNCKGERFSNTEEKKCFLCTKEGLHRGVYDDNFGIFEKNNYKFRTENKSTQEINKKLDSLVIASKLESLSLDSSINIDKKSNLKDGSNKLSDGNVPLSLLCDLNKLNLGSNNHINKTSEKDLHLQEIPVKVLLESTSSEEDSSDVDSDHENDGDDSNLIKRGPEPHIAGKRKARRQQLPSSGLQSGFGHIAVESLSESSSTVSNIRSIPHQSPSQCQRPPPSFVLPISLSNGFSSNSSPYLVADSLLQNDLHRISPQITSDQQYELPHSPGFYSPNFTTNELGEYSWDSTTSPSCISDSNHILKSLQLSTIDNSPLNIPIDETENNSDTFMNLLISNDSISNIQSPISSHPQSSSLVNCPRTSSFNSDISSIQSSPRSSLSDYSAGYCSTSSSGNRRLIMNGGGIVENPSNSIEETLLSDQSLNVPPRIISLNCAKPGNTKTTDKNLLHPSSSLTGVKGKMAVGTSLNVKKNTHSEKNSSNNQRPQKSSFKHNNVNVNIKKGDTRRAQEFIKHKDGLRTVMEHASKNKQKFISHLNKLKHEIQNGSDLHKLLIKLLTDLTLIYGFKDVDSDSSDTEGLRDTWMYKLAAIIVHNENDKAEEQPSKKEIFAEPSPECTISDSLTPIQIAALFNFEKPLIARCIADVLVAKNIHPNQVTYFYNDEGIREEISLWSKLHQLEDIYRPVISELAQVKMPDGSSPFSSVDQDPQGSDFRMLDYESDFSQASPSTTLSHLEENPSQTDVSVMVLAVCSDFPKASTNSLDNINSVSFHNDNFIEDQPTINFSGACTDLINNNTPVFSLDNLQDTVAGSGESYNYNFDSLENKGTSFESAADFLKSVIF